MSWLNGGGLRPVVVVTLLAALFIAFPDRNFSFGDAEAASSSPECASGVGIGGPDSNTVATTVGGHGCVVIKYISDGVVQYETFNYTGADQTWTVPSGVTSAIFFLIGAGGGGATYASFGDGGGGGYATGSYAVTAAQVLTIIVGQRGGGDTGVSGTVGNCLHTRLKYGGGGQGGSCQVDSYAPNSLYHSSGGGRSAIRLSNNTEIATAGGGGGGGYGGTSVGGAGGGTTGVAGGVGSQGGGGGTQSAGGARGYSSRSNGTAGSAYLGGRSDDEGGGGGGGYYGGGGGGDNAGGGGGSSYVALLTSGSTTAGSGTSPGGAINSLAAAGGVPSRPTVQNSCSQSGQNLTYSITQTSAGASAITNYEYHLATSRPVSEPTSWTAFSPAQTSTSLTWDMRALGFNSGTVYKHYVRAVNAYGTSESSWNNSDPTATCSASFSAAAPGAPTSLTATPGSGSASISFTAGSANGAAISNYEYSLNGTSYTALSPADASSPITIPGLTGGTSYTIYLKARNSAGLSSASSAVTVTPLAAAPTVSSVSGTSGTSAGGTAITITGTNFLSGATVTVGGAACTSVTVVSATSITCTTPAGSAGAQDVVVTNTDTQSATLSGGFTYIAPPSATATPAVATASDSGSSNSDGVTSDSTPTISVGSATNGNTVTVTATKAGSANVTCTFTATAQSSCDLGTLADGTWSVTSTQTNSGVTSAASSSMSMTIDTARPTVSSFSSTKADGTYGIGTTINITATMSETVADGASITVTLDTGDTVVLTKASGTTLTGTYTVGVGDTSSDLTVSSYVLTSALVDTAGNAMTSTSLPTGANNIAGAHAIAISTTPPVVSSASSSSGTVSGGTSITITGTGFASGATVTIGGSSCTSVVVVSSTSITCTTPAGTTGAKDVVVTNSDTQASTLAGGFTYLPAAPGTPDVDAGSDTGSSSSDNITSDNTPTLSVSGATNGNTVTITATKSGSANVTCTFTATAQTSCNLGTLADGVWSITSKQTGGGVDSAISAAVSVTVDTTGPTVSSFSTTQSNGTFGVGSAVNITATMNEAVADGASITVTLNTGDTVVLTKASGTTLTGTYTVGAGVTSSDLTVSSYVLTSAPVDTAGNVMTSTSVPSGANNIAGAHAIVIDTTGPVLNSTSINSAGTQITLSYYEALHATSASVGEYAVTVGGVSLTVNSVTVSGSTILLNVSPAAAVGSVVSVTYSAPTSNSATSNSAVQDAQGNDAGSSTSSATVTVSTTTTAAPAASPTQSGTTTTTTPSSTTTTTTSIPSSSPATTTTAPRRREATTSTTATKATVNSFVPLAPLAPLQSEEAASSTVVLPEEFTSPNPLLPVVDSGVVKIIEGMGAVAGMAPDGWVKVEPVGTSSVVLTTSDGLRIEIAALTNSKKLVRLNSRGMVVVEHDDFITVAGGGLLPNSDASTWLFSTPRELGRLLVDENGNFSQQYQIGLDVPAGDHTAQINGIAPDGTLRSVEVGVEVIERAAQATPYNPRSEPRNTIDLTVQAMVLLTVLGSVVARKEERESGDVAEVSVSFRASNTDGRNDVIRPLALPALDRLSHQLPTRMVRKSPLIARVLSDGVYLRALMGVWWLTLPAIGLILGALAANNTDYQVIMPSIALIVAIMVVGIADALSGFIAIGAFAVLVGINGGFNSGDSVRGILGIWVLGFAVSMVGSAVRPFRRLVKDSRGVWQRTTDAVLIALFGAWAAGAMFSAIPALTGVKTADSDQLDLIRIVALLALVARYGVENLSRILAPKRLTMIENQSLPEASRLQQVASLFVRTAVFIFVALIFIGNNWALWLGGCIYLVPKLVGLIDDAFPDFNAVHRFLPRGILKTVVMLFVAKWWGDLVADNVANPDDMVQYGFVLLGIPGLVLGAISWFGRSSKPWPSTLLTKVAGTALLLIGLLRVLG
jgi:hypothetical protein